MYESVILLVIVGMAFATYFFGVNIPDESYSQIIITMSCIFIVSLLTDILKELRKIRGE